MVAYNQGVVMLAAAFTPADVEAGVGNVGLFQVQYFA